MAEEATPVDFLPHLPPRTELEQLTDALEAGLITPALFARAKAELLSRAAPPAEAPPARRPPAPAASEPTAGDLPPLTSFFTEPAPAAPTPPPRAAAPVPPPAPARAAPTPAPPSLPERPTHPLINRVDVVPSAPLASAASPAPAASQPAAYVDFLGTSAASPPAAPPSREKPAALPHAAPPAKPSVMPKVLLAVGILGLLLLLYWQVAGSHPDEQLTSPRQPTEASAAPAAPAAAKVRTRRKRAAKAARSKKRKASQPSPQAADSTALAPTPSPSGQRSEPKPKVLAAAARPTTKPASAPADASSPPEPAPRAVPPAPEAGDSEGASKVRATMAGYYADMLVPPFTAARHFAPHVERLYIQQNLTPADIDGNFNRNFFLDNKQAVLQIEPGTLRVSAPAADGTRMATFVEASRVYHPSRQGYQRLRAQVRARFDADYKIIYLRQERLLESTFE